MAIPPRSIAVTSGAGDIPQLRLAFNHRRDQQVFGASIDRGLHDVDFAAESFGGGIGEGGFADAGFAEQARVHRQVAFVDDEPGGKQLAHHLFLADPADGNFVGVGQGGGYAVDINCHRTPLSMIGGARAPESLGNSP